jgi:hypothetical protein
LKIKYVEFSSFGNVFTFKWNSFIQNPDGPTNFIDEKDFNKNDYNNNKYVIYYGIIKANSSSLVGYVNFDPKILCEPKCYLGIGSRTHDSIIDQSYSPVTDLNDLNSLDPSALFDLWIKSFQLTKLDALESTKPHSDAFDIDSKLFELHFKRWEKANEQDDLFKLSLRLYIEKAVKDERLTVSDSEDEDSLLSYSFPISFKLKWPRFLKKDQVIYFPPTQVHVGQRIKNITLHNPSNSTILMQIMLLDNYPQKENLLKLISRNPILNPDSVYDKQIKSLAEQTDSSNNDSLHDEYPIFNLITNKHYTTASTNRASKISNLNLPTKKNTVNVLLEPHQTQTIQILFKPEKMGVYKNLLVIRNNLTVLDAYFIKAKCGSAQLTIDDMPPMKTSVFFSGNSLAKEAIQAQKTSDSATLEMLMSENDFKICKRDRSIHYSSSEYTPRKMFLKFLDIIYGSELARASEDGGFKQVLFMGETKNGLTIELPIEFVNPVEPTDVKGFGKDPVAAFETKDGIILRSLFRIKNTGNAELIVYHVLFDGEPCFSSGFGAGYCRQFALGFELNSLGYLDIRYQPDFTVSLVTKSLTLITNIGTLEYAIQVKIPYHMLITCHDSLPRIPFEHFLFILCIASVSFLLLIVVLGSIFESKTILKYQSDMRKQIFKMNEEKVINVQDFVSEYQMQCENNTSNRTNGSLVPNGSSNPSQSATVSNIKTRIGKALPNADSNGNLAKENSNPSVASALKPAMNNAKPAQKQINNKQADANSRLLTKSLSSPKTINTDSMSNLKKASNASTSAKAKPKERENEAGSQYQSETKSAQSSPKSGRNKKEVSQPSPSNSPPPVSNTPPLPASTEQTTEPAKEHQKPLLNKSVSLPPAASKPAKLKQQNFNSSRNNGNESNSGASTPSPQPLSSASQFSFNQAPPVSPPILTSSTNFKKSTTQNTKRNTNEQSKSQTNPLVAKQTPSQTNKSLELSNSSLKKSDKLVLNKSEPSGSASLNSNAKNLNKAGLAPSNDTNNNNMNPLNLSNTQISNNEIMKFILASKGLTLNDFARLGQPFIQKSNNVPPGLESLEIDALNIQLQELQNQKQQQLKRLNFLNNHGNGYMEQSSHSSTLLPDSQNALNNLLANERGYGYHRSLIEQEEKPGECKFFCLFFLFVFV